METVFPSNTLLGSRLSIAPNWAKIASIVLFSLLIGACAQISIPLPFTPVPITGQTFAVLLSGVLLGSRAGMASVLLYMLEGGVGLPVFAQAHAGFHWIFFAPSSGYLLAFPLAAFMTGLLAEKGWDKKPISAGFAMLLGSFIILFCGWLGLLRFFNPVPIMFVQVKVIRAGLVDFKALVDQCLDHLGGGALILELRNHIGRFGVRPIDHRQG